MRKLGASQLSQQHQGQIIAALWVVNPRSDGLVTSVMMSSRGLFISVTNAFERRSFAELLLRRVHGLWNAIGENGEKIAGF